MMRRTKKKTICLWCDTKKSRKIVKDKDIELDKGRKLLSFYFFLSPEEAYSSCCSPLCPHTHFAKTFEYYLYFCMPISIQSAKKKVIVKFPLPCETVAWNNAILQNKKLRRTKL